MPDFLEVSFTTVSPLEAASQTNDAFSPDRHCWHLRTGREG